MAKFMILYTSSVRASDLMASSTPEQIQASMAEWMTWREEAEKKIKVGFGMPLQATKRLTAEGAEESDNKTSGYAMLEGDKEDVLELLKTHPHLKRADATIEVLEFVAMPGLE